MIRWKNLLLVVAAVLVINLPLVHGLVQRQRLASSGVDVRAAVLAERTVAGQTFLAFSVPAGSPEAGDPGFKATVRVDRASFEQARAAGAVEVRVLPGSTTVWRADGQVTSHAGLVLTLGADLLLVVMVLLYLRFRHRLRPELVLVAEEDLESGADRAAALERLGGQRYLVSGVVESLGEDAVVLDVGGRRVRVLLDGHRNPARPDEAVSAVGTMVG